MMIKKCALWASLSLLFSCKPIVDKSIIGKWNLQSEFYQASYQIFEEEDKLKAYLLKYNDGTSAYAFSGKKKHYLFQSLKEKNGLLIDGTSGASQMHNPKISLKPLHLDTLEVTTYLMNKPLKEIWIRNTN